MRRLALLWIGLLCALAQAAAPSAGPPSTPSPSESAAALPAAPEVDADLQILVLIRRPPEHFRPGSSYSGSYGDVAGRSARRRTAQGLARDNGLTLNSDWPITLLGVDCFVLSLAPGRAAERAALVQALARDPRVAWAQAMNVYQAQSHNDPLFAVQPVASAWHLAELHRWTMGAGVRVAVVDSGVESQHPDLAGQVELSENFIGNLTRSGPVPAERHGTEVAGIIAARADNRQGIVGVAPQARLLALRACWQPSLQSTLCSSLGLALALSFAIEHDAQVINLSLSGPVDRLLGQLIDQAQGRGIEVVSAVDPALPGGGFPASHPGVFAVASQEAGRAPAVAPAAWLAPGKDVPTTGPPDRWYLVSGSSYAAAHLSGLLALLRGSAAAPGAAPAAVTLVRGPDGAVDACASLARRAGACPCACGTDLAVPQAASP
jgi:subtilisin family serine protease